MGKSNRKDVIRVSPELDSALIYVAVIGATVLGTLNIFLLSRMFGWFAFSTQKVDATTKSADNIYTRQAAEQYARAAEANKAAQDAALYTARVNQQTEELRLERARLEKTG